MQTMSWAVLGKMFPEKCPLKIVPKKIVLKKIASPPPFPMNFFCDFFLIPNFYFYESFRP